MTMHLTDKHTLQDVLSTLTVYLISTMLVRRVTVGACDYYAWPCQLKWVGQVNLACHWLTVAGASMVKQQAARGCANPLASAPSLSYWHEWSLETSGTMPDVSLCTVHQCGVSTRADQEGSRGCEWRPGVLEEQMHSEVSKATGDDIKKTKQDITKQSRCKSFLISLGDKASNVWVINPYLSKTCKSCNFDDETSNAWVWTL